MKNITSRLKDKAFTEHLDEMQLALFTDNRLDQEEREEVFKHLSHCKQCRDVLKMASEIRQEEEKKKEVLKPANNIDYKRFIPLGIIASLLITTFTIPSIAEYPDERVFKSFIEEKSFIDKSIYYWECRFNELFGGGEG